MEYVILVNETAEQLSERQGPKAAEYWGAYTAYGAAMREAGVIRGGNGLLPPHTATTVRVKNGERQVLDGPHVDSKEQLGGYYVIDVPSLDEALAWAARCPAASTGGSVEVRPVMTMSAPG